MKRKRGNKISSFKYFLSFKYFFSGAHWRFPISELITYIKWTFGIFFLIGCLCNNPFSSFTTLILYTFYTSISVSIILWLGAFSIILMFGIISILFYATDYDLFYLYLGLSFFIWFSVMIYTRHLFFYLFLGLIGLTMLLTTSYYISALTLICFGLYISYLEITDEDYYYTNIY